MTFSVRSEEVEVAEAVAAEEVRKAVEAAEALARLRAAQALLAEVARADGVRAVHPDVAVR